MNHFTIINLPLPLPPDLTAVNNCIGPERDYRRVLFHLFLVGSGTWSPRPLPGSANCTVYTVHLARSPSDLASLRRVLYQDFF